jgi:methionine-rich copper-binding protein CopC
VKVIQRLEFGVLVATAIALSSATNAAVDPQSPAQRTPNSVGASLVLVFSDRVILKASVIEIRDTHNRRVQAGSLRFGENGLDVEIPLEAPLPPGQYTIKWRAISVDGRETIGGYGFTIAPAVQNVPTVAQQ